MATPTEEELDSHESLSKEAISHMKRTLPEYVVNCFVASGFDTLPVISDMDISSEPGNSLQEIEHYINDECSEDPGCTRTATIGRKFKFPPGHRHAIENFVKEVKELQGKKKMHKRLCENYSMKSTKRKVTSSEPNVVRSPNQVSSLGDIRRQVAKWQRSQKEQKVLELKEHEHFEVHVDIKPGGTFSRIHCQLCGKDYSLGKKEGKSMISNWTKHVGKCVRSRKSHSHTLNQYLLSSRSSSECIPSPELVKSVSDDCSEAHPIPRIASQLSSQDFALGSQNESINQNMSLLSEQLKSSIEEHPTSMDDSSSLNESSQNSGVVKECNATKIESQYFRLPPPQ